MAVNVVANTKRGYWYIDDYYYDATGNERRLQRSTHVPVSEPREMAEKVAQDIFAKVATAPQRPAVGPTEVNRTTLEEAFAMYRDVLTADEAAAATFEITGIKERAIYRVIPKGTLLVDITEQIVTKYIATRRSTKKKNNTIRRELSVLRGCFKAASVPFPKCPDVEPGPSCERTISMAQTRALLAELPQAYRDHLRGYRHLGVRKSELYKIFPEHVHLDERWVYVDGSKTEESKRHVPLSDDMMQVFKRLLEAATPGKPLFRPWTDMANMLYAAAKRAGIPHAVSPNDFRRSFTTDLLLADETSSKVAALLGHTTTIQVDKVYGRLKKQKGALLPTIAKLGSFEPPTEPKETAEPEAAE